MPSFDRNSNHEERTIELDKQILLKQAETELTAQQLAYHRWEFKIFTWLFIYVSALIFLLILCFGGEPDLMGSLIDAVTPAPVEATDNHWLK